MSGESGSGGPEDWRKAQREAGHYNFPWRIVLRIFLIVGGLTLVAGVFFGIVGFALDWFRTGRDVFGPENVTQQFELAYQSYEALEAQAQDVCFIEQQQEEAETVAERSQRRDQLLASQQNYERIRSQYEARYDNAFQAGLVGPRDLPKDAPTLAEMKALVCLERG